MDKKKEKGNLGEKVALEYLKQNGYSILKTNYFSKFGEIDIIAEDKGVLSFIEVKTRRNSFISALSSVSHSKQKKLHKTAQIFLQNHPEFSDSFTRFDVIAIISNNNTPPKIKHIKDAFRVY